MQLFQFLKKFFLPLFIFLVIIANASSAQVVKVGFMGGINRHTFSVTGNEGGILQPATSLTPTYGLEVIWMKNQWGIHTGYFSNDFSTAFSFESQNSMENKVTLSTNTSTKRIPIIFSRKIKLTDAVSISPQAGFSWLIKGSTDTTGVFEGSLNGIEYQAVSRGVNQNIFLAEAGLDLNFQLNWLLILKIGARYSYGLEPIERTQVSYQYNGTTYTETIESSATGWNFNVGLVVPIYN